MRQQVKPSPANLGDYTENAIVRLKEAREVSKTGGLRGVGELELLLRQAKEDIQVCLEILRATND